MQQSASNYSVTSRSGLRWRVAALACAVTLACCPGILLGATPRAMSYADALAIKGVSAPALSPDGNWVLYTVREWEPAAKDSAKDSGKDSGKPGKKTSRTHLWIVPAKASSGEGAARQMTFGDGNATNPAWSPDGKTISFLASRKKGDSDESKPKRQIWIMRADGGEAWQLTDSKESVSAYAWSPDSSQIAYSAQQPLAKDVEAAHKRGDDAKVYEGDFRSSGLYVVGLDNKKSTLLTSGQTFTISGDPTWSPDGGKIAFAAKPTPMIRDFRNSLYIVEVSTKALHQATPQQNSPAPSPQWSPDGSAIAFTAVKDPYKPLPDGISDRPIGNDHLMLYHVASGQTEDVSSPSFDLSFGEPVWTPDSKSILFHTGSRVYNEVFSYDVASRKYRQLTHEKNISFGTVGVFSRDGSVVAFTMQSPNAPSDVYVADASFSSPRKLTDTNPQVRDFALGDTEPIEWKSSDGTAVQGLLVKPAHYQAGTKYPTVVIVHGGPTSAYTNSFSADGQVWAGQGWAVLYPNPRGSTNYGEKFMRANIQDWGGGDYHDIMAGADAVVARGIADPNRMAEEGWSYGGYMTCWIVSQTSRFKAAMMGAGLSDLVSMANTTDIPDYIYTFFDGYPTKSTMALYEQRSGITYASHVTTPLLILQGGADTRVPTTQSIEFFRALKDRGKTVKLVFYPGEGHGLQGYYHQYDRMRRTHTWIAQYTLGTPTKAAGN